MISRERAYELRAYLEKGAAALDDCDASQCVELYPKLKYDGSLIEYKCRINWHGRLKQAKAALWDTIENDPEHAPDMWSDIKYRNGIRIIPASIAADEAFDKDELGWWGETLYKSLYPANVHTPAAWPQGWEEQTNENND